MKMSLKLRQIYFFLGVLWTTTLPPGSFAWSKRITDEVPIKAVTVAMADYPAVDRDDLVCPYPYEGHLISKSKNKRRDGNRFDLICRFGGRPDYDITIPIMHKKATYIPKRLTVTVSKGEDVTIGFHECASKNLSYQKEPVSQNKRFWKPALLNKDNETLLKWDTLSGSGFYSFIINDGRKGGRGKDLSVYGTIAVLIRDCERNRYGEECQEWCPDCMYGGVCHSATGKCVCPPRRSGDFCEKDCLKSYPGEECKETLVGGYGNQICLPSPYGCSCPPGFTGLKCDQDCDGSHWGVDCSQSCRHCLGNTCDSETGQCNGLWSWEDSCAGGSLGLPRFRKEPKADPKPNGVDVVLSVEETFDGKLPKGSEVRDYQVVVWKKGENMADGKRFNRASSSTLTVTGLDQATEYEAAVLVRVQLSNSDICIEDGTRRGGRIHKIPFNTSCPDVPPAPTDFRISNRTSSSFSFSWKEFEFGKKCGVGDIRYELRVERASDGWTVHSPMYASTPFEVTDLESYTNYKVIMHTTYSITRQGVKSKDVSFFVKTLPKLPVAPPVEIKESPQSVDEDQVTFQWETPRDSEGEISYYYRYKINYKACDGDNGRFSKWVQTRDKEFSLLLPPYVETDFRLMIANEAGNTTGRIPKIYDSHSKVPDIKVSSILCQYDKDDNIECQVFLERDCRKVNGAQLSISYKVEPVSDELKKYERESLGIVRTTKEDAFKKESDDFEWTVYFDYSSDLLSDTQYQFTASVINAQGRNTATSKSDTFTTKPVPPRKVQDATVITAHDSLTVEWNPPSNWPPTGDIENYRISWKESGQLAEHNHYTTETNYVIRKLKTNTTYIVKVFAKNKGVDKFSDPATLEERTVPHKPGAPDNISYNSSLTEISVNWEDSETFDGAGQRYFLLKFQDAENKTVLHENTTEIEMKFSGLQPDHNYTMQIKTCNKYRCSDIITEALWTQPSIPEVENVLKVLEATGNSSKISLPIVKNPPAWQFVVVTEIMEGIQKELVKTRSLQLAEEYTASQRNLHKVKKRSAGNYSANDIDGWVAAELYIEDDSTTEFVIGDGEGRNQPLKGDKEYNVVVVTEKKSGPLSTFAMTDPINVQGTAIASGLSGILFGVIIFLVLILLFAWSYKKKQSKVVVRKPLDGKDAFLPVVNPVHRNSTNNSNRASLKNKRQDFPTPTPINKLINITNKRAEETEEDLYANISKKIRFADIEAYLSKAIHSSEIDVEFASVPKNMEKSCSHGEHSENRLKNRYRNNLPYNDTRVRLPRLPQTPFSDYINANYIQGHLHPNAYIATQGPKDFNKDTIDDFWRMVWHTDSRLIIMVANLMENGKVKVAQYWPGQEPIVRGGIEVTLISTKAQVDFIIRTLTVKNGEETRTVLQYQYISWPDHGVPQNPFGLAQMLNNVRSDPQTRPIVVHCSAGIGRTGTIILALTVLDQINKSGYMDAHQALKTLRDGRGKLVENTMQYNFAHKLLQEIMCGEQTSYSCNDFEKVLQQLRLPQDNTNLSAIEQQFHKMKSLPKDLTFKFGQKPGCAPLNRNPKILPADSRLVFLHNLDGQEESQYINAVWVRSIDQKNAYIVGEHPQQMTLEKMWRLMYEKRISVWTLIHSFPDDDQEYPAILPKTNQGTVGDFAIAISFSQEYENFVEYHITMKMANSTFSMPHNCIVVMMKGWPHTERQPSSLMPLLAVMERAESLMTASSAGLFTCKDGVTGCGILMAILQVIGRMKLLQEVDVYRSVLGITYDRPEFIVSEEQYDLIHDAVILYLSSYSNYSNFC